MKIHEYLEVPWTEEYRENRLRQVSECFSYVDRAAKSSVYAVCVARAAPGVHGACVHTRTGENSAGSCVCICMRFYLLSVLVRTNTVHT